MASLRNHARCRELEDTLRSLERQQNEAENEIARGIEDVGNLRGQVHVELNTLSSLEEAVSEMRQSIARSGGRIVIRPTIGTAMREAVRLLPDTIEEYSRQEAQLRGVEARLANEEALLAAAKDTLRYVKDKIAENYEYQRRNNC